MFLEMCEVPFTATEKTMINNCAQIAAVLHTVLYSFSAKYTNLRFGDS
jgi:hypothetical protein